MRKPFNKAMEHKGGLYGITSNPNFPRKHGIHKTGIEEHKEIRAKAEAEVERREREEKSEQDETDEVIPE